jgi:hypothetical protein
MRGLLLTLVGSILARGSAGDRLLVTRGVVDKMRVTKKLTRFAVLLNCSSPAATTIQPTCAIALPAPFLIPMACTQAGGAGVPIGFVQRAAIHARAPLACGDLRTLAID